MSWVAETGSGVRLRVHVQPRASRTEVAGLHGEALKIRLAAPPVDGAANEALIEFLSHQLDVPRRAVELLSGLTSRAKAVRIEGLTADEVRRRLRL
jgi:uncharacterized protein (TIGR00251 family)